MSSIRRNAQLLSGMNQACDEEPCRSLGRVNAAVPLSKLKPGVRRGSIRTMRGKADERVPGALSRRYAGTGGGCAIWRFAALFGTLLSQSGRLCVALAVVQTQAQPSSPASVRLASSSVSAFTLCQRSWSAQVQYMRAAATDLRRVTLAAGV